MPKIADDTLLRHAIGDAILDRESLAQAYHGVGPHADEAKAAAVAIKSLTGKRLSNLTAAELETARLCFIFAEQYEQSRFDAGIEAGSRWQDDPKRRANMYRELRLRLWGQTKFEADIAKAGTFDIEAWAKKQAQA